MDRSELRTFVTCVLLLFLFIFGIWAMIHWRHHETPPPRTWQQWHMDKAYHDCIANIANYDPTKVEHCYLTVYGRPSPAPVAP